MSDWSAVAISHPPARGMAASTTAEWNTCSASAGPATNDSASPATTAVTAPIVRHRRMASRARPGSPTPIAAAATFTTARSRPSWAITAPTITIVNVVK